MKYIFCIKQIDQEANQYDYVECFEDYEEAEKQCEKYEKEYTQAYWVERIELHLKEVR